MLGALGFQGALLAVIAAVIALVVAELVRYFSVGYLVAEPAPAALPRVVLVNGMLSSWIGGLAAHSLSVAAFGSSSPALVGSELSRLSRRLVGLSQAARAAGSSRAA